MYECPDNYTAFDWYEREQERSKRYWERFDYDNDDVEEDYEDDYEDEEYY